MSNELTMMECVKAGLPLRDILIIDEHAHLGPYGGNYSRDPSAESLIADMDSQGITKAVVSHMMSLSSDYRLGNDKIMAVLDKYPDRFLGYCTINPLYSDEVEAELIRCFQHPGMVGIKLHPWCHDRPMSYRHYRPAYIFAQKYHLPVMTHTYTAEDVDATDRLAVEFPEVSFIMAHMGGEGYNVEKALDVAKKHGNVFGDIAVSQSMEGRVEKFVKEIGANKLIFGTDTSCMNPIATFAMIAMAEISDEEKKMIFGLNMQGILDKIIRPY